MAKRGTGHADHEPKCLAMLICDTVVFDPASSKSYILGAFDSLRIESFPAAVHLSVYIVLTDCLGRHSIKVVFSKAGEDAMDDEDFLATEFDLASADPLDEIERVVIADAPIHGPGTYFVSLFANDNPLSECRLVVFDSEEDSP